MRHEPPVLTDSTPGAAVRRVAGPVVMADARDRRLSQDHAPRQGMSMILTKAFYRIFAVIAFGVGALGVVITLNDFGMVLLGAPLMLLGFVCGYGFAFGTPSAKYTDDRLSFLTRDLYAGDSFDGNFLATGELREIDQLTRGEGRFAESS